MGSPVVTPHSSHHSGRPLTCCRPQVRAYRHQKPVSRVIQAVDGDATGPFSARPSHRSDCMSPAWPPGGWAAAGSHAQTRHSDGRQCPSPSPTLLPCAFIGLGLEACGMALSTSEGGGHSVSGQRREHDRITSMYRDPAKQQTNGG